MINIGANDICNDNTDLCKRKLHIKQIFLLVCEGMELTSDTVSICHCLIICNLNKALLNVHVFFLAI